MLQIGTSWDGITGRLGGVPGSSFASSGQGLLSNIELNGGFIGEWVAGDYTLFLGPGPGQMQITGGTSGFAKLQTDRPGNGWLINGNSNYEVVWGSPYFKPDVLALSVDDAYTGATQIYTGIKNKFDLNGATRTIGTYSAAQGGVLSGVIRNSTGTAGLTKVGPGFLTLSGANTFNGVVTVNQGKLNVSALANGGAASGLGTSSNAAANVLLANGTTLAYTGAAASTDRGFTINGTAAGDSASLDASGTGAVNFTNTASPGYGTAGQTRTLILTGTNTFAGGIADAPGSVIAVTATSSYWTLSGANTYSGNTSPDNVTLTIKGKQALSPNSTISFDPSSGSAGGGGGVLRLLMDDSGTVNLGNNVNVRTAQTSAAAQWTIYVGNNGGATTGSTLALGKFNFASITDNRANGVTLNVTGANSYRLQLSDVDLNVNQANTQGFNPTSAPLTIAGTVKQINGKAASVTANGAVVTYHSDHVGLGGTVAGNLVSGTIADASDYTDLSNPNARPLGVIKSGAGDWSLSGANTYSGTTRTTAGTLIVNSIANGGTASSIGKSTSATAGLVLGGGTLQYAPINAVGGGATATDRNFALTASTTLDASGTGALVFNSPTGNIVSPDITTGLGGTWATTQKVVTGLSSTANLAIGMRVSGTGIAAGSTIASIDSATQITLSTNTTSVGSADIAFGYTARTLTLAGTNTGNNTLAGILQNSSAAGAQALSLTKSGAGTWVLSGANTYTGATTVSNGTLLVNGNQSAATGAVSVAGSATLGGSGTIGGAVSLIGGTLSPGTSPGTLTVGTDAVPKSVTMDADATYKWEFDGSVGDLVVIKGDLNLAAGWNLALVAAGGAPAFGSKYDLFTYTGSGPGSIAADIVAKPTDWPDFTVAQDTTPGAGRVYLKFGQPGDTNGDGVVDAADYITVKRNFGQTVAKNTNGDLNSSGTVDWEDLAILMTNFGAGAGGTPGLTPEPATLGLLAFGAAALIRRRRA